MRRIAQRPVARRRLDAETQSKLMDALAGLEHTMSVVLITHRAELLGIVDRVIEVEGGGVVD